MAFTKNIQVQASEPGGADWFPYGHQVSLRTLIKMFRDKDLTVESVCLLSSGVQVFAYEEKEEVTWTFWLQSCPAKLLESLGWFKPVSQ